MFEKSASTFILYVVNSSKYSVIFSRSFSEFTEYPVSICSIDAPAD